jgi:Scavenger receptor cysteine-rich domain
VRIVTDPVSSNPPNANAGRLEAYHSLGWGAICTGVNADLVDANVAKVVCKSLGKTGGKVVTSVPKAGNAANGVAHWTLTASCTGTEASLKKCKGYKLGPAPYYACGNDALISCS